MDYKLLEVNVHNRLEVQKIKFDSIKPYVEAIWGWDSHYQKRDFVNSLANHQVSAIQVGDCVVGMLEIWEDDTSISIVEIHIIETFQGKGIGQGIIRNIMNQCQVKGKALRIGCFKKNVKARDFYKYLGFSVVRISEHHYEMIYLPMTSLTLTSVSKKDVRKTCFQLMQDASLIVAKELKMTKADAKGFSGFMDYSTYCAKISRGMDLFTLSYKSIMVGTGVIDMTKEDHPVLRYIAINKNFQGRGYGKYLMKSLENQILLAGGNNSFLGAISENKSLIRWYESMGYITTASKKLSGGKFHVTMMRKEL